jgi:hypothetical protein
LTLGDRYGILNGYRSLLPKGDSMRFKEGARVTVTYAMPALADGTPVTIERGETVTVADRWDDPPTYVVFGRDGYGYEVTAKALEANAPEQLYRLLGGIFS